MKLPKKGSRLFSVEEANGLIPEVRTILHQLRKDQSTIEELEKLQAVEELSWLSEDGTVSPAAEKALQALQQKIEAATQALKKGLGKFDTLGVQLKGLEEGLVDFFTARGDDVVFLCWKDGEEKISYWHDLETGFTGRQPLETL